MTGQLASVTIVADAQACDISYTALPEQLQGVIMLTWTNASTE